MSGEADVQSFKDLVVWQRAMDLCVAVYQASRSFPADERFGLVAELRKTARSIPYNIAEGNKRRSTADYLRFLGIASGSGGELETQLLLAERLGYLAPEQGRHLLEAYGDVARLLAGLVRSLKRPR